MAEIVHSIAPDAQIYFYTGEGGQSAMANAVTQLAANGCNIICDDLQYPMEPFYQENGLVSQAIDQAVTGIQQVTYLTAATNYGPKSFYESNFLSSNFQANLPVGSGGAQQKYPPSISEPAKHLRPMKTSRFRVVSQEIPKSRLSGTSRSRPMA